MYTFGQDPVQAGQCCLSLGPRYACGRDAALLLLLLLLLLLFLTFWVPCCLLWQWHWWRRLVVLVAVCCRCFASLLLLALVAADLVDDCPVDILPLTTALLTLPLTTALLTLPLTTALLTLPLTTALLTFYRCRWQLQWLELRSDLPCAVSLLGHLWHHDCHWHRMHLCSSGQLSVKSTGGLHWRSSRMLLLQQQPHLTSAGLLLLLLLVREPTPGHWLRAA
jgi:hypothetical protein